MEEQSLAHHGIKGMKWGVRRTPEQLGHQNAKLERRAVRYDLKAGKYAKRQARYSKKLIKAQGKLTGGRVSGRDIKRARRTGRKYGKISAKSARYQLKAAKARARILKNKEIMALLETKVQSVPPESIARGKAYVEELLS